MHYPLFDLAEFAFILILFVMPGLFAPSTGTITLPDSDSIPWLTVAVYGILVLYMMVRYHSSGNKQHSAGSAPRSGKEKFARATQFFTQTVLTYAFLSLLNLIVSKAADTFGMQPINVISDGIDTRSDKIFLVFWVTLLAAFEEFTYRWLLPARLHELWDERRPEDEYTTTRKILCEAVIICLFALSHRYMNWWAVLNAFIAGIILRTRFFVTGSVYPALIGHALYNLSAFYGILSL